MHRFADHTHYVQGVSWDPCGRYVATESNDRCVADRPRDAVGRHLTLGPVPWRVDRQCRPSRSARIYQLDTRKSGAVGFSQVARFFRAAAPSAGTSTAAEADDAVASPPSPSSLAAPAPAEQSPLLFLSESIHQSYFRRLAWSPDGGLLVLPSGQTPSSPSGALASAVFVVTRANLTRCAHTARTVGRPLSGLRSPRRPPSRPWSGAVPPLRAALRWRWGPLNGPRLRCDSARCGSPCGPSRAARTPRPSLCWRCRSGGSTRSRRTTPSFYTTRSSQSRWP